MREWDWQRGPEVRINSLSAILWRFVQLQFPWKVLIDFVSRGICLRFAVFRRPYRIPVGNHVAWSVLYTVKLAPHQHTRAPKSWTPKRGWYRRVNLGAKDFALDEVYGKLTAIEVAS